MTTLKTLLVGAAVGAVLAVAGVGTAVKLFSPATAADVAKKPTSSQGDPLAPPDFYGAR